MILAKIVPLQDTLGIIAICLGIWFIVTVFLFAVSA